VSYESNGSIQTHKNLGFQILLMNFKFGLRILICSVKSIEAMNS